MIKTELRPGLYEILPVIEEKRVSILVLPGHKCIVRILDKTKESFVMGTLATVDIDLYLGDGQELKRLGNDGFCEIGIIQEKLQGFVDNIKCYVENTAYLGE